MFLYNAQTLYNLSENWQIHRYTYYFDMHAARVVFIQYVYPLSSVLSFFIQPSNIILLMLRKETKNN